MVVEAIIWKGGQVIQVFRPSMGDEEVEAVAQVLKSGWIGLGPRTRKFEEEFAQYIGSRYAIGVNSCTAALHLAIKAAGIDSGEIVTTPITFVSTAHAILYNNATPVFADVQEDTLNIDPVDIEQKITSKTRAIIPVHYGGHPCDMDEISEISAKHGLWVIEDAAHACGAEYKGKKAGTLGHFGCFSFHAIKNLATCDGGMITTNDEKAYQQILKLRWMGINADTYQRSAKGYSWDYEVESLGFKEHMNDIIAAIGLVQLRKLNQMNARRREIVSYYNQAFKDIDWIETPVERQYVKSSLHHYAIKVNKRDRNELIAHLAENGISATVHYRPLYLHPIYKKLGIGGNCPVADKVWLKVILLPLYLEMSDSDINLVVSAVKSF